MLFHVERMQRRMHNKLLIVEGAFAIAGGRNIADDYFQKGDVPSFLNVDALFVGAVVPQLAELLTSTGKGRRPADIHRRIK
ncbi:MAG: phospholipase family protein [Ramlibacter sp.]|nr:phospholipase family protein [Ramlibacter sp.]